MNRAAYLVLVRLPPGMSPEQGGHELGASISFGSPEVTYILTTREPDEEPDAVG
jgi:hypothetical protein